MNAGEVKRWKNRIWHPEINCEEDKNEMFDKVFQNTSEMKNIYFEEKEDLYLFLDYGIKNDLVRNNDVQFIRGDVFDIYILTDYRYIDDCYRYVKELINDSVPNCRNKYIVCDNLETEFDYSSANYFLSKLKSMGCRGILYHIPKDSTINNFYSCTSKKSICENMVINKNEVVTI